MRTVHKFLASCVAVAIVTQVPSAAAFSLAGRADDGVLSEARRIAEPFPPPLRPMIEALYRDGEWNAVLNLNQLGLAAMELGERELAKKVFDEAIARIEAIFADDENARKAKSVFNEEKVKDFKGEPYERAMTYFYRGVLYGVDGDFQNARAAFLAADRQDTISEQETFAGDFGIMKYLAGWASYCDNDRDRGRTLVVEAKTADASIARLPDTPKPQLVLFDAGTAPVKVGTGKHKELLTFERGTHAVYPTQLKFGDARPAGATFQQAGDVYFQASTRGGRPVDGILDGKARFKDGASEFGQVATQTGQVAAIAGALSGNRGMAGAGLIGMLVGLVAEGVAASTTPAADLRRWSSLPDAVAVYQSDAEGDGQVSLVTAMDTKPLPLQGTAGGCRIAWGRSLSSLPTAFGGTAQIAESVAAEDGREARNRAMRAMLSAELPALRQSVTADSSPKGR